MTDTWLCLIYPRSDGKLPQTFRKTQRQAIEKDEKISNQQETLETSTLKPSFDQDFVSQIEKELSKKQLFVFAKLVDKLYSEKFSISYSTFTLIKDSLMTTNDIMFLYDEFRTNFSMMHAEAYPNFCCNCCKVLLIER